jgi:hypothetical protein
MGVAGLIKGRNIGVFSRSAWDFPGIWVQLLSLLLWFFPASPWQLSLRGQWRVCHLECRWGWSQVAHVCNPSYSWGRDQEDCSSEPAWANSSWDSILKKTITRKGLAQGIGPEFKPQSCKKNRMQMGYSEIRGCLAATLDPTSFSQPS